MSLADLQRAFWNAVRKRGAPPPGLEAWFVPSRELAVTQRIAIYHHAYWQRQLLALRSTFSRTEVQLGASAFERLVLRFLERVPGTDPCIERLGQGFPEFLREQGVELHELEVARLEWAATAALIASDSSPLRELPRELGEQLAGCQFTLAPSVQLVRVQAASLAAFTPSGPSPSADAPHHERAIVYVALSRPRFAVVHVLLEDDEAEALRRAQDGQPFSAICEAFASLSEPDAAARAVTVLRGWLARGWVVDCRPPVTG